MKFLRNGEDLIFFYTNVIFLEILIDFELETINK